MTLGRFYGAINNDTRYLTLCQVGLLVAKFDGKIELDSCLASYLISLFLKPKFLIFI